MSEDSGIVDDAGPGRPPQPTIERRSEVMWLKDRDIVLYTVQQANDGVHHATYFGVRKSTLSRASLLFSNMFDIDQDPFIHGSEKYDGLPAIHMHDDPLDLETYLLAIHLVEYLFMAKEWPKDSKYGLLDIPSAYYRVLRLVEKYVATDGLMQLVAHPFHKVWPSDFSKWEKRMLRLRMRVHDAKPTNPDPGDGEFRWDQTKLHPNAMLAYAFALKHQGITKALPAIACDIASAQTRAVPFSDGGFRRLNWSMLSHYDAEQLRMGCQVMRLDCLRKLDFGLFTLDTSRCRNNAQATIYADELVCHHSLQRFWERHVMPLAGSETQPTRLMQFPTNLAVERCPDGICAECTSAMVNHIRNTQYVVWIKLPIYFRLTELVSPTWGFGLDSAIRFNMLPRFWQKEVESVARMGPGDGQRMFEQLRSGSPP